MPSRIHRGVVLVTVASSVCAVACASILGFGDPSLESPDGGGNEAGGNEDAGKDAVVDAGPCNRDTRFQLRELEGISDLPWETVRAATLSADELHIYFQGAEKLPNDGNIYTASRGNRNERFGEIHPLAAVNTDKQDFGPAISGNETQLVFVRQVTDDPKDTDLFFTSQTNRDSGFQPAQPLKLVNSSTASDVSPFLTLDGTELWFTSNRLDGGQFRIHHARASGGSYMDAEAIESIDGTPLNQGSPVLSADREVLFYAAPATGEQNDVVWEARRDGFGKYKVNRQVSELNTGGVADAPSWLSPDGCRLYVHSRVKDKGQIFVGIREP